MPTNTDSCFQVPVAELAGSHPQVSVLASVYVGPSFPGVNDIVRVARMILVVR